MRSRRSISPLCRVKYGAESHGGAGGALFYMTVYGYNNSPVHRPVDTD